MNVFLFLAKKRIAFDQLRVIVSIPKLPFSVLCERSAKKCESIQQPVSAAFLLAFFHHLNKGFTRETFELTHDLLDITRSATNDHVQVIGHQAKTVNLETFVVDVKLKAFRNKFTVIASDENIGPTNHG